MCETNYIYIDIYMYCVIWKISSLIPCIVSDIDLTTVIRVEYLERMVDKRLTYY